MRRCLSICLAMAWIACSRSESRRPKENSADAQARTDDRPKKVILSPQVMSEAKIRTAPAAREALRGTIDLPGEIGTHGSPGRPAIEHADDSRVADSPL